MCASTWPRLTLCPSRTSTVPTTPALSARTACHSNGSTLPLVGRVLMSVCRLASATLTLGGWLLRSTPQAMTPAATTSSKMSSFFN